MRRKNRRTILINRRGKIKTINYGVRAQVLAKNQTPLHNHQNFLDA